ncbi:MAG: flagellar basal body-associated FliL family protein [Syntrophobacterales bacterium]|nr:MAG: flagellar basal body-associated FliL family protein [Syntrophobacterales bacterium]
MIGKGDLLKCLSKSANVLRWNLVVVCIAGVLFAVGALFLELTAQRSWSAPPELQGVEDKKTTSGLGYPIIIEERRAHDTSEEGVTGGRFQYLKGFVVCLDRCGDKILVCDMALELRQDTKLTTDRVDLRKAIYDICLKISDIPGTRRFLKKEIKTCLNELMGGDIIQQVYFTKFVLL